MSVILDLEVTFGSGSGRRSPTHDLRRHLGRTGVGKGGRGEEGWKGVALNEVEGRGEGDTFGREREGR